MKRTLTMIMLALLTGVSMMAQDVEAALERFDKQASAANANKFFGELKKAEFIDEMDDFGDNTPVDSLQQQVWFWAAEWMYDQQQFDCCTTESHKTHAPWSICNPSLPQ